MTAAWSFVESPQIVSILGVAPSWLFQLDLWDWKLWVAAILLVLLVRLLLPRAACCLRGSLTRKRSSTRANPGSNQSFQAVSATAGISPDLNRSERSDEKILDRMRDFRIRGLNQDPLALESLRDDIVAGLKQFEYRLWREIEGGDEDRLYLAGADEVPAGYRDLVEEYFTNLASGD